VIKGYAEYIMDAGTHDDRALREVMKIIVESCDRVIDMVDTLIEVSRVEQGAAEQTLQIQKLDLREVALSSVETLKHAAAKKSISLDLQFPGEPLDLFGDSGLLHQVVRKLVDNALKYSPSGARVAVRGRADGDGLVLEVEDHGIGIPPEHLRLIFEKFYMVDGGIARRVGGTGVGLYLVREIVRLHSGTVDVRSLPGQGSVFSVRLPRRLLEARTQTAQA
jgi:two-component system phosphate regulon sensor histidine kinase PhoR